MRRREGWGWAGALGGLAWIEMGWSTGWRPQAHSPLVLSLLSPGNRAHFVYGIACDHGCIWDLKFCPSGAWELPGTPRKAPLLPRLGLLALACSDGKVLLFSLPHPEALLAQQPPGK